MNKDTKALVPELRFPGFEGEWIIKKVGEIFEVTRGYVLAMHLLSEHQNEIYPYPVYSSQTKKQRSCRLL